MIASEPGSGCFAPMSGIAALKLTGSMYHICIRIMSISGKFIVITGERIRQGKIRDIGMDHVIIDAVKLAED
ncbi:hypothetical protein [Lacrimispora sp.]|jgi:hypothetical protein|uniref:hypothetical protein n=1 Tax=Lacrimispora sp. TaxID=2719234 RepID=UPI0028A14ED5|nr:hypothetical protein [Lacrimispora sp.]